MDKSKRKRRAIYKSDWFSKDSYKSFTSAGGIKARSGLWKQDVLKNIKETEGKERATGTV